MHVNRIVSPNFNGIFGWFLDNYELSTRIDPDANPLGWQDEIRSLSSDSDTFTHTLDYTPPSNTAKSVAHESTLLESVKSLSEATTPSMKKELLMKIRGSVDDMIKTINIK